MKQDLLSAATKWYHTKVAYGAHLSDDTLESWHIRQQLHASMWRKYLDRVGVFHIKNTKIFTIDCDIGCITYEPSIIVPMLDITFVDPSSFHDVNRGGDTPEFLIPLHLHFDISSGYLDLEHIFSASSGGFAVAHFPTLPCSNFDQHKKQHHLSEGRFTECAFQNVSFRSDFLTNQEYKEGKYAKSVYFDRPVYFTSTTTSREFQLRDFNSDIFGRLFLVSESEMYSKQESVNSKFRLDPCIDIANDIVIECYEKYKDVYWMQELPR